MIVTGATSFQVTRNDIITVSYRSILRNAVNYARQCTKMILMASEKSGLDKVFEATYGKTMKDYLNGCLSKVKSPKDLGIQEPSKWDWIAYYEDIVSCYLGFLTAVEAITTEAYTLTQHVTEPSAKEKREALAKGLQGNEEGE
jgi:hypothetical protein